MKALVKPELLRWARIRARLTEEQLAGKMGVAPGRVYEWEAGTRSITIKQTEKLAQKTHVSLGRLFSAKPPQERLPIPDYRSVNDETVTSPSPELFDTLRDALRKQEWYREYLLAENHDPLPFVGALSEKTTPTQAAGEIKRLLRWDDDTVGKQRTWEDMLRTLMARTEESRILVIRNGIVGSNTHRSLSVAEFRGFVLSDVYAPLVFLNGRDAKAAQIFTLIHELTHIGLGKSGLPDVRLEPGEQEKTEKFCNRTAAEFLTPEEVFRAKWDREAANEENIAALTRYFKVSRLVATSRAFHLKILDWNSQRDLWEREMEAAWQRSVGKNAGGGDYYRSHKYRESARFSSAVIISALEGKLLYRDALRLLGIKKFGTFEEYARRLGE